MSDRQRRFVFRNRFRLVSAVPLGVLGHAPLIPMPLVLGKRTLPELNAFDLVVTVALGSTPAANILSENVTPPGECALSAS